MTTEFHVVRDARERYALTDEERSEEGHVILAGLPAVRALALRMNERRGAAADPTATVSAAELHAMGIVGELLHLALQRYRQLGGGDADQRRLEAIHAALPEGMLDEVLRATVTAFPPPEVERGEVPPDVWLEGTTEGMPNRQVVLDELLLLWVNDLNPALVRYRELFDLDRVRATPGYGDLIDTLCSSAREAGAPEGARGLDLVSLLRAPALAAPGSLAAQLRFMREAWDFELADQRDRLLVTLGVLEEEERAVWQRFHPTAGDAGGGDGAGRHAAPGLGIVGTAPEEEAFSQDLDWMPSLVLMAKSAFVWLDQLSRRYRRDIWRLDQVPDDELDRLADAGFSGLWLIGLWERSRASASIKRMRGNPDAVASAYSLYDYTISADLGGEGAYRDLRDRAWQRRIRLASDMVPNHMGIDSRWVVEHPEWFLGLDQPPYPAYSFTGPDLSSDPRVEIRIEDHYWEATDAAVVFQRVDRETGQARYIYHGNDGTSMPWNDTAQLDYLNAEVREAVIQTILNVARQFPVIRFDAAMTLAKRHIRRLWFPAPGEGGSIPSRAEHALPDDAFERAIPQEFWREVVDRVAQEVPDTLLLAEAFWMLEGYFVRTLGMHRVYNSAFMHMFRDEDNAGYRTVMKDTLAFDPEILKRYVNFMNNPDERTAVDQFGDGDKYFGVATVMATMPGLPMFGHGQIEGFTERYGMEYRRAKLDEQPKDWLVERHRREIFPLLHRRRRFAEVEHFALYDFQRDDGSVDENVFAYSNGSGAERSLVVYHDRYGDTSGTLQRSVPFAVRDGESKRQEQRSLADALGIEIGDDRYLILGDHRTGQELLRRTSDLARGGLRLSLGAYGCLVFLDLREVQDADGRLGRLHDRLGGAAVPSVEQALLDEWLEPVHAGLAALLSPDLTADQVGAALRAVRALAGTGRAVEEGSDGGTDLLLAPPAPVADAVSATPAGPLVLRAFLGLRALAPLGEARPGADESPLRAWRLDRVVSDALERGGAGTDAWRLVSLLEFLLTPPPRPLRVPGTLDPTLVADRRFQAAIGVHEYEGVRWFSKEAWEQTIRWLLATPSLAAPSPATPSPAAPTTGSDGSGGPDGTIPVADAVIDPQPLFALAERAGYRFDALEAVLAETSAELPEPPRRGATDGAVEPADVERQFDPDATEAGPPASATEASGAPSGASTPGS